MYLCGKNSLFIMTLLEKLNTEDHFAASIGAQLIHVAPGVARSQLTVTERHLNGGGVCQGGVLYTLADLAFAAVVNSHGILTTTSKLLKKGGKDSAKNPVGKFLDVDDVEQLPEVGS